VTAPFRTDRGDRELSAWEVTVTHLDGPVTLLDPRIAAEAWFPSELDPGVGAEPRSSGTLHDDGRTLTLTFAGIPREYADYPSATVLESDTAVLLEPVSVSLISDTAARHAHAEIRQVTISLSRPLGARVLITPRGHPVPVSVPTEV
jgi:hypothetical protein